MKVLIEGWIGYPHSYALVNIYQMLALAKMPELIIYFSECRPYKEDWPYLTNLSNILITEENKKYSIQSNDGMEKQ